MILIAGVPQFSVAPCPKPQVVQEQGYVAKIVSLINEEKENIQWHEAQTEQSYIRMNALCQLYEKVKGRYEDLKDKKANIRR